MADAQRKESDAFLSFLSTFELSRPVATISDLNDGTAWYDVLAVVDAEHFRQPSRPSSQPGDNWVLRLNGLKRLYRLMIQYFSEVLRQPTFTLDTPDLQAIAKDSNVGAILMMCRLTLAIAVQSEQNQGIIARIQKLGDVNQHYLMKAIELVMAKVNTAGGKTEGGEAMTEDDHYYQVQSDRSRILAEKDTLEGVYQALLEEHRTLQTNMDDMVSERDDAVAKMREARREVDDMGRSERSDTHLRAEIDRLRADLQKSEDNLGMAEAELDKNTTVINDLNRKVDELQDKADQAVRLKDQLDEYRHAADKLQKTENVMEKYKKKLQESSELRQTIKSLEKQNADLVDKNAAIEEEYRKVAAFKPLMESYKTQIAELETKGSSRTKELEGLKFDLQQAQTKLKISVEERARDSEALELYQERVRELELASTPRPRKAPADGESTPGPNDEFTEAELMGHEEDLAIESALGSELDDAIAGTTMTDLKLQIRKLKRDLEAAQTNSADASRVLVLENLLEDANRMKARYEADYLAEHREKLVMQSNLEEIRSGKSMGDGAEAAIALRQRLNETVEQLDALRKEHTELEVKLEAQSKELTIAKSDLNLVNKDQLEILASLRESVNEDKTGMEADMDRLRNQIKELSDKNRMQLEQVNSLLMEKVNLQSEGIGQRERMLERERDFNDLRSSISGKDLPEDIKKRLLGMHEENMILREQYKTSQEKLLKAKAFIKSQDKLFKEEHAKAALAAPGTFEEAEGSFRAQLKIKEEEVARYKQQRREMILRYRKEQELMLSIIHKAGMKTARDQLGMAQVQQRSGPSSWLATQRKNAGGLRR